MMMIVVVVAAAQRLMHDSGVFPGDMGFAEMRSEWVAAPTATLYAEGGCQKRCVPYKGRMEKTGTCSMRGKGQPRKMDCGHSSPKSDRVWGVLLSCTEALDYTLMLQNCLRVNWPDIQGASCYGVVDF